VRDAYEGPYDPDDAAAPHVRIMTPTHLAAIWQSDAGALTPRRQERIVRFREAGLLDEALLALLLSERS
jgi:hypothetical protein